MSGRWPHDLLSRDARLMKLMCDMFGGSNVTWSNNSDRIVVAMDEVKASIDPNTLV